MFWYVRTLLENYGFHQMSFYIFSSELITPNTLLSWSKNLHIIFLHNKDYASRNLQRNFQTCPFFSTLINTCHSLFVFTVPHVEILDERGSTTPEKYYKAGSTIELQCVISKIPQPSSYITWRHNTRLLNYDTSRGGIR